MTETNTMNLSEPASENHWDLYKIYDFWEEPPADLLDFWQQQRERWKAFHDPIYRKIGNTLYQIESFYDGNETLTEKVRRMIFNDPVEEGTAFAR